MTISKELLKNEKLVCIDIPTEDLDQYKGDIIVNLFRQNKEEWYIKPSVKLDLAVNSMVDFSFIFDGHTGNARLKILEAGEDYYVIKKPDSIEDEYIAKLVYKLNNAEKNDEEYGRRKEPRIKIGVNKYKEFGLGKPEQRIILEAERYTNICALADVSMHGIQIVTPYSVKIKDINNFYIMLNFEEPNQNIIIDVHKVYMKLNKINDNVYANICCQILEPINYIWKERIISLISKNQ